MNVLVIGGAGFLGSHLVDRLIAEDHAVDVVDDLSTGSLANLAEARSAGGALKIHTLDVLAAEFAALTAMRSPDVVYHLAWMPPGRGDAVAAGRGVQSVLAVLEAVRSQGAKVVTALPARSVVRRRAVARPADQGGSRVEPGRPRRDHRQGRRRSAQPVPRRSHRRVHGAGDEQRLRLAPARRRRRRRRVRPRAAQRRRARRSTATAARPATSSTSTMPSMRWSAPAGAGGGLVVNIGTGVSTSIRDLWTHDGRPRCAGAGQRAAAHERHRPVRRVADTGAHPPRLGAVDRPRVGLRSLA